MSKKVHESRIIKPVHKNSKHSNDSAPSDLVQAYSLVIKYLGRNKDLTASEKRNYADTAVRAAKALVDLTLSKTEVLPLVREQLETGFPLDKSEDYKPGIIIQGPIETYSMCPHHLLGVTYDIFVAYVPKHDGVVLGISKLSRIAEVLSKRPVLQEQLAADIADVFCINEAQSPWVEGIESSGSAVLLIGRHSCMTCRGVQSNALTGQAEMRGVFFQPEMEQKFLALVRLMSESRLVK